MSMVNNITSSLSQGLATSGSILSHLLDSQTQAIFRLAEYFPMKTVFKLVCIDCFVPVYYTINVYLNIVYNKVKTQNISKIFDLIEYPLLVLSNFVSKKKHFLLDIVATS